MRCTHARLACDLRQIYIASMASRLLSARLRQPLNKNMLQVVGHEHLTKEGRSRVSGFWFHFILQAAQAEVALRLDRAHRDAERHLHSMRHAIKVHLPACQQSDQAFAWLGDRGAEGSRGDFRDYCRHTTHRNVGRWPSHLLRPALPIRKLLASVLPTCPTVAQHLFESNLTSPTEAFQLLDFSLPNRVLPDRADPTAIQ